MLKNAIKSFSVYTITSIVCAGLSVFILPVLTAHLSKTDYGITALFSTYVMIVSPLLGFSAGGYFWTEFFKMKRDHSAMSKLFSTYFWAACSCMVFTLVLVGAAFPLVKQFSYFSLLFLFFIPLTALFSTLGEETKSYFVNNKRPVHYFVYSVSVTILELALSYYLVVHVCKNWEGRIYAWIISLLVQFIFTIYIFGVREKYLKFDFVKPDLKALWIFGYPLIFHQLGKFIINQSDRLFIAKMISVDEAGIYSIGYQVGSMLMLPINAFANFYAPFVYERLKDVTSQKKIEIGRVSYIFAGVIIVCFILMVVLAPLFFELFIDKKFHDGLNYVFWVAMSYVFWGLYMLFSACIFFKEKTKFLGWLSVLNIALNAGLNYFLINLFGAIGAAYATAISFFIVFVITAVYSNKLEQIPWFYFLKKNAAKN